MEDVKRIELRFDVGVDGRRDWPAVTVLVDGEDFVSRTPNHRDFMGFDPEHILGGDSPLLPTSPPRRVAVYRCSCGEPGCGVVAPLITEADGLVKWSDFRDFTGVFDYPTVDDAERYDSERLPITTLFFDAAQYRAEVERASGDDSWVTPARKTAMLLRDRLLHHQSQLAAQGLHVTWVAPDWNDPDGFAVSLESGDKQIVVKLTPAPGDSEQQVSEMLDIVLNRRDSWKTD